MNLLIIRHAIAEERSLTVRHGRSDEERRLTPRGRSRMRRGSRGIARLVPHIDLVATSPLVRAVETARIVADACGHPAVAEVDALRPGGDCKAFLEWMLATEHDCIAAVGHEPDLGLLVGWLLTGRDGVALPMRKGGACLLEFDGGPSAGGAALRWFLPPALLRRIRA